MTTFLILFMVGVIFQEMFAAEKGIAMAETVTMNVEDPTLIALLTVQNPKDFSSMRKTVENIGNAMPILLNIMPVTKRTESNCYTVLLTYNVIGPKE